MCSLKYSIKPGFYTGSRNVPCGVGVTTAVATYVLKLIFKPDFGPSNRLLGLVSAHVLTIPYIGVISKSIWPHFLFKYNPEIAKKMSNDTRA